MLADELLLDSGIRNWVLIPLCLITFLVGLLRHYLIVIAQQTDNQQSEFDLRANGILTRSRWLRGNGTLLLPSRFKYHVKTLSEPGSGLLFQIAQKKKLQHRRSGSMGPMDALMNPTMMKMNLYGYLPMILMVMFVNNFFSGFIVGKLPLTLHPRLKPLFQRDVDLPALPAAYVTSFCLYIFVMFGLRGVYSLLLEGGPSDDLSLIPRHTQQAMGPQLPGDPAAPYESEAQALANTPHVCELQFAHSVVTMFPPPVCVGSQ